MLIPGTEPDCQTVTQRTLLMTPQAEPLSGENYASTPLVDSPPSQPVSGEQQAIDR